MLGPLQANGQDTPGQQTPAAGPPDSASPLDLAHGQARGQFDALAKAKGTLDKIRAELTQLASLGDSVTEEDVIKSAGKLVAHGIAPVAMAGVLSGMPPSGGQALAGWVQQQAQAMEAKEAQLVPMLETARHGLGVMAMHSLVAHAAEARQAPGPLPSGPTNPLMPGGLPAAAPQGTA